MLATKRRTKLSNEGLRQLNMVVRTNENKPFFSSTTIQRAEDKLKNLILFEEGAGKDLKLCSLTEIMNERLNRLESEEKTVVWSLDKGRRRVIKNTIFAQLMEVANESPEFEAAFCRSIDILAGKSNIKF